MDHKKLGITASEGRFHCLNSGLCGHPSQQGITQHVKIDRFCKKVVHSRV
jgi:hypothetical protein